MHLILDILPAALHGWLLLVSGRPIPVTIFVTTLLLPQLNNISLYKWVSENVDEFGVLARMSSKERLQRKVGPGASFGLGRGRGQGAGD